MTKIPSLFRRGPLRAARLFLLLVLVGISVVPGSLNSFHPPVAHAQAASTSAQNQDLFGVVSRDPFYEWNTDPVNFPNAANKTALEQEAKELQAVGARWVRMEFFADYDGSVPPGDINWAKYDYFINELAPKYGLHILALLNVGMVSYEGKTVRTIAFNDPPDGAGSDPNDGSNHFIRVFTGRAQEIAARYGQAIGAYEIINEPNISYDLWIDSKLKGAEIKPDRYAALLASAYRAIKGVSPQSEVITGGLMIGSPPEGKGHDEFDYLYQLYVSQWTERYRQSGMSNRPGWSSVPWDGVALHPYFLDTPDLFALINDFARKLRDRGDFRSKIWITEIGAEAAPPTNPQDPPTNAEQKQAAFLRALYSGILNDPLLRSEVAHVF